MIYDIRSWKGGSSRAKFTKLLAITNDLTLIMSIVMIPNTLFDIITITLFFRPSSGEVLAHCLFWSKAKQLKFFQQVSDWIKTQPLESTTVKSLEKGVKNVFMNDWKNSIDEELKQGMINTRYVLTAQ